MSDKTLDDLILTDPEPEEEKKSKSILVLLALVVLLIVVGAILAKMIFSSPEDNNATIKDGAEKSVQEVKINKSKENSSDNTSTATGTKKSELSPLNENGMPASVDTVTLNDNNENKNNDDIQNDSTAKSEFSDNSKNIPDSVEEHNKKILAAISHKNNNKNSENKVITHEKKPKAKHKTVSKPKIKHTVYGGAGNVYIQVGSFAKGPDSSFINKILKAHFKYRIKEVNGYRRVLVGPFRSSAEAQRYLGTVKAKISQNAFIKK